MLEGIPAALGTFWGSGLILCSDVFPCSCLPPSPGPPRPCSTLMPKALPRRHEVSLSELRSQHRDAGPARTSCPCHSQTSHLRAAKEYLGASCLLCHTLGVQSLSPHLPTS